MQAVPVFHVKLYIRIYDMLTRRLNHTSTMDDGLLPRTVLLALVVVALNGVFTLEQPDGSFLEFFWRFRWLLQQLGMEAVTRLHVRDTASLVWALQGLVHSGWDSFLTCVFDRTALRMYVGITDRVYDRSRVHIDNLAFQGQPCGTL